MDASARLLRSTTSIIAAAIFGLAVGHAADAPNPEPTVPQPPALRLRRLPPAEQDRGLAGRADAINAWYTALPAEQRHLVDRDRAARRAAQDEQNQRAVAETNARRRADDEAAEAARAAGLPPPAPTPAPPRPERPWQDQLRDEGFSAEELARLARDKFIIEDRQLRQSFDPYTSPRGPVFVTTDSWLNAFHVLFEDTLHELELRRVPELRRTLQVLLAKAVAATGPHQADFTPARQRIEIVVGTASKLLGDPVGKVSSEVAAEIDRQVALVRAAERKELPAWLGAPGPRLLALDYRRCRPVGFYADGDGLPGYFRAVRWLQMVPFRADRDDELLALVLLAEPLREDSYGQVPMFLNTQTYWLGPSDDPALLDFARKTDLNDNSTRSGTATLSELRWQLPWLVRRLHRPLSLIPDNPRLPPEAEAAELEFRILPSAQLPDALFLQSAANRGETPGGLMIAAALGSSFARERLVPALPQELPASLNETADCVYARYLGLLWTLASPAEPDAPAQFSTPAWSGKTCLTVLGSWAQMRHATILQAKASHSYEFAAFPPPPGFVEPVPQFFSEAATLCRQIDQLSRMEAARTARDFPATSESKDAQDRLARRWQSLEGLALRLAVMAHKQLRRQPWTDDENSFINAYGEMLAEVMNYTGTASHHPRDDAPRCAEVHRDPNRDRGLTVGIGRPRVLWVLYPWQGREILCRGAVLMYHESWEHERLTDAEWRAKLDSPDAPPAPDWLMPVFAK